MTNGTQRYRGISCKSDRLAAKWTACGSVKDHAVEAGLAELVRDVDRCVERNKCGDVSDINETLLKSKKELNGEIREVHTSAARRLRGGGFIY